MHHTIHPPRGLRPFVLKKAVLWAALALLLTCLGCTQGEPSVLSIQKGGGGELRALLPFEPRTLDPNSEGDEAALTLAPNLFNKLVTLDADARILPDLAESWTVSADGRTYTFRLHDGIRWHDGRPLTSADVRWTFTALAQRGSLAREALRRIAAVEAPDPGTVVLRLRAPWAPFLPALAGYGTFILPRHRLAGRGPHAFRPGERLVGTGPFQLESWERGRQITLVANRRFFRAGPYLDRVVYLPRSPAETPELLLSGKADCGNTRSVLQSLAQLARSPRLRVLTRPSDARYYFAFNLRRPPFADRRVRQAVNQAIDREALLELALAGYGAPAYGFYTPAVAWAYNSKARVPPFDPVRARALLDAAGLRADAGIRARWDLVAPDLVPVPAMVRVLAGQLRAVGVEIRPVLLPTGEWLPRLVERHDFDLGLVAGSQGPDPESLALRFGSRGPFQFMGYSNPELDDAVARGAATVDLVRRAAAYFRVQEILANDLPIAPLAEAVHVTICARSVHGLPQAEARGLVAMNDYSLVRLDRRSDGSGRADRSVR